MAITFSFVWWDRLYDMCYLLYEKIIAHDFRPDVIIGIARGGWIPARILSDIFFTRETANVKVDLYRGIYERDHKARIVQALPKEMKWKTPLLVDDISDTGDSLIAALEHAEKRGLKNARTATIHVKPWTKLVPDFYVTKTEDWVVYPWEGKEFTFQLARQLSQEGKSPEEIEAELYKVGLPMYYSRIFFQEWLKQKKHKSKAK
jgi:hypoxanthine phosphoribosyltransferase